jgi:hypothetical protein
MRARPGQRKSVLSGVLSRQSTGRLPGARRADWSDCRTSCSPSPPDPLGLSSTHEREGPSGHGLARLVQQSDKFVKSAPGRWVRAEGETCVDGAAP